MNVFIAVLLLSAFISISQAALIFHRVKTQGAKYFSLLMLAVAIWCLCYAVELGSSDLPTMVFWASSAYFGILLVPAAWLAFTLAYTGREGLLKRRFLILLSIVPLLILALVWSNPLHNLFYSRVILASSALGAAAVYGHGPVFWVHAGYSYILLLAGSYLLVRSIVENRSPVRGQVVALLAAVLAPWIGNAIYLSGYNPIPQYDLTPLAFLFTGLAVSWALFRYQLLDIVPVAHATLIANLQDGLIVLDSRQRIVELNPAAELIFSQQAPAFIGRHVLALDWGVSGLPPEMLAGQEASAEVIIGEAERRRYYDLRSSPLKGQPGIGSGHLLVLRDITERVRADETLDRSEAILEAVSFAATRFITSSSIEEVIAEMLERFGEAAHVSRVYVLDIQPDSQGTVTASLRHEWAAEGVMPRMGDPRLQNFSFLTGGLARWEETLGGGGVIYGSLSSFPPREQEALTYMKIKSITVAPIFVDQAWWGCIGLDEDEYERQWTKAEIDALQAAAGVIGSSLQRQRIERSLRKRADELSSLHEVSLVINSPRELTELLRTIVERAMTLLGGTAGGMYLCYPEKQELRCVVSTNTSRDFSDLRLRYGEGAAGIVAQTGRPLIIDDYTTWEGRAEIFEMEQPFRSVMSVPLIWQEQILGVLHILNDDEPYYFSDDNLTLGILFADLAAVALHKAQAYLEAQESARRITLLNEITQASIQAPNLETMLQTLAERLCRLFEADDAYITFWDEEHQAVVPAAAHGLLKDAYTAMRPVSGEVTLTSSVLKAGHVLVAEDVFCSPHVNPRMAALFPARSMMALPLVADGKSLGAALLGFNHPRNFTQGEIALAEEVSAQVSLAMTKIRLLDLERRRASELEALRETFADISTELDLAPLLQAILKRAVELLNATGGDLGLFEEDRNDIMIVVSHNMGKDYTGLRMAFGEGAMGRAVQIGEPVVIDDYQNWDGRSSQYVEMPYHAVLAVPLLVRGRTLGALGIVDRNPRRIFTPDDQRLLYLFSQQAANAIEKARLYGAEKRRAAELEQLFESSTAMVKTLDPDQVCGIATQRLAEVVGATSARILSCDLDLGLATVLAEYSSPQANVHERISDKGRTYNLREYPQTLASLRMRAPQVLLISSPDLHPNDRKEMLEYGIKSALNLPMSASDRVIGYAEIWDSRTGRVWTEEEIQFCQTLANQAALVIDNARLYRQMQHLAVTDTLTGVYNRRGLFEYGQREVNRALRTARPLAAIMLDIDHFKQVNDAHSHAAGDQVLQALAKLCLENLREVDVFGRYGGEEFAALLPDTDIDSAVQVAERLRQCVSETEFGTQNGPIAITISLGVACTEGDISSLAVLLDRADTVMYDAKHNGRNRVYQDEPGHIQARYPRVELSVSKH